MHASWLAGEGYKRKISLYDACVTDIINSYIQCTKAHGFLTGRYKGTGPSMDTFLQRVSSGKSPSPAMVSHALQSGVGGINICEEPILHGNNETIQRKKTSKLHNSSHKPGYVMESRKRKQKGRPRKISFGSPPNLGNNITDEDDVIQVTDEESDEFVAGAEGGLDSNRTRKDSFIEDDVIKSNWAFRRMPSHCSRKCFGVVKGKKCKNIIQNRSTGLVAPCFWSSWDFPGSTRPKAQWFWFCVNVEHTRHVDRHVKEIPDLPSVWPVQIGTNITAEEGAFIQQCGFQLKSKKTRTIATPSVDTPMSQKRSRKWRHGISKEAEKRLASADSMIASIVREEDIISGSHVIFHVRTENLYLVHVKAEPSCSCPDFQKRESGKKPYLACKHIYFVFVKVLGLDRNHHMMIHQPTLSPVDVNFVLSQPRHH